ncbi:MAG: hypothetical protein ACI9YT_000105 [Halobacteriales archaeon]|jgi:hypothetical protein
MADFSSCYFCGAALDAPLEEYPVVPAELHPSPERQGTVVLCPTCREKLDAILEEVIAAVEVDSSLDGRRPTDSTLQAATKGATSGVEAEPEVADDAEPGAPEDPEPDAGDDAGSGTTPDAEAGEEAATGDASDDETGSEPSTPTTTAASESDSDSIFDDGSSAETDESDPYGPVFEDDEKGAPSTDSVGEDATDEGGDEEVDDRDRSTDDRQTSTASADRTAGSTAMPDARTYNRVVRLLQNREFPVERDEIETVATNAYELSHEEFDAVIRVAIDRGVLEEADGQLVLPGGE